MTSLQRSVAVLIFIINYKEEEGQQRKHLIFHQFVYEAELLDFLRKKRKIISVVMKTIKMGAEQISTVVT